MMKTNCVRFLNWTLILVLFLLSSNLSSNLFAQTRFSQSYRAIEETLISKMKADEVNRTLNTHIQFLIDLKLQVDSSLESFQKNNSQSFSHYEIAYIRVKEGFDPFLSNKEVENKFIAQNKLLSQHIQKHYLKIALYKLLYESKNLFSNIRDQAFTLSRLVSENDLKNLELELPILLYQYLIKLNQPLLNLTRSDLVNFGVGLVLMKAYQRVQDGGSEHSLKLLNEIDAISKSISLNHYEISCFRNFDLLTIAATNTVMTKFDFTSDENFSLKRLYGSASKLAGKFIPLPKPERLFYYQALSDLKSIYPEEGFGDYVSDAMKIKWSSPKPFDPNDLNVVNSWVDCAQSLKRVKGF